jgi:hypothetical protein
MLFRKSPFTVRIIRITDTLRGKNAEILKFKQMVSIVTTQYSERSATCRRFSVSLSESRSCMMRKCVVPLSLKQMELNDTNCTELEENAKVMVYAVRVEGAENLKWTPVVRYDHAVLRNSGEWWGTTCQSKANSYHVTTSAYWVRIYPRSRQFLRL